MTPAFRLQGVSWVRDGRRILDDVHWVAKPGEHWIVLGPNGCGKTTLMRILSLRLHPTEGTVEVLGERLGGIDVRVLRQRIGVASAALADQFRSTLTASEIVVTGRYAALEPWWHEYTDADLERAQQLLTQVGAGAAAGRTFGALSSGERQRTLLARTLMSRPDLLLLDEPTAGLDLTGREQLVTTLGGLASDPTTPATVLVTHHVDEIPPGFTHALLLTGGRVLAAGPVADTITSGSVSELFDVDVEVEHRAGRWSARATLA